ncbi:hypothetical protein JW826_05710 [Candidatus Woesearchaeota archaeon]|nr:hypothetical protein [Candidatus Woesearchaeota archaeon]
MIEIEKTYLSKSIPPEALKGRSKEITDVYIPPSRTHPDLRIRKNGDKYEITRKNPARNHGQSRPDSRTRSGSHFRTRL